MELTNTKKEGLKMKKEPIERHPCFYCEKLLTGCDPLKCEILQKWLETHEVEYITIPRFKKVEPAPAPDPEGFFRCEGCQLLIGIEQRSEKPNLCKTCFEKVREVYENEKKRLK
jgi:hypothetical protein